MLQELLPAAFDIPQADIPTRIGRINPPSIIIRKDITKNDSLYSITFHFVCRDPIEKFFFREAFRYNSPGSEKYKVSHPDMGSKRYRSAAFVIAMMLKSAA